MGGHMGTNITWCGLCEEVQHYVLRNLHVFCVHYLFLMLSGRRGLGSWFHRWSTTIPRKKTILVVVGCFSKRVHLGMLQPHYITYKVALLFIDIVWKIHGMPCGLVSDHDLFLLVIFGKRCSNSVEPYYEWAHPISHKGGKMEVLNYVIEKYLHEFMHSKPTTWGKYLVWVEWSYNVSQHYSMGKTPFEVTFCKPPPPFLNIWIVHQTLRL